MRSLFAPGFVLGIGLGGFVDGIVFHQLLQTHGMLTARFPKTNLVNFEVNMFWDGVFHACTWLATAAGVALLFRAGRERQLAWDGRVLVGGMLAGWGAFNLVEGVIDHHLLHLHHVVEQHGVSLYDGLFLLSGILFLGAGLGLVRSARGGPGDEDARHAAGRIPTTR